MSLLRDSCPSLESPQVVRESHETCSGPSLLYGSTGHSNTDLGTTVDQPSSPGKSHRPFSEFVRAGSEPGSRSSRGLRLGEGFPTRTEGKRPGTSFAGHNDRLPKASVSGARFVWGSRGLKGEGISRD